MKRLTPPGRLIRLWLVVVWVVSLLIWTGMAHAQTGGDQALVFFQPVRGSLNDTTPAGEWTWDGRAGQVVSLIVVTTSGDLDPTLAVVGPDGALVAENDDIDSLVTDAGLEALALPADGVYTVRVTRYQGESGTTSGEYELVITPGFASLHRRDTFDTSESPWLPPEGGEALSLSQGGLRVRVVRDGATVIAAPSDAGTLDSFYMQVDARLDNRPSYAEVGLVFRSQLVTGGERSYQFKVNTEGKWTVLLSDPAGVFTLRTWASDRALSATQWTLAVLVRGSSFEFYGNGALLGSLSDSRLAEPGGFGLLVATREKQPEPADVIFDNLLITTRLGTTYSGLPLALAVWDNLNPQGIVTELAASGQITPAPGRDFFVPQVSLTSTAQQSRFELVGTETQTRYVDFVLGAQVVINTGGQDVGCGLVFHWQNEHTLEMAYVDSTGGFGLVQSDDGVLTTNVYDLSSMVKRGAPNDLLVISQGGRRVLYINGAMVADETVAPGDGRIGIVVLNFETAVTECLVSDYWVWPLAG